ncbi:putative protein kinase RLK-Pelle-URK-2 family [Helianthus annuus]|nr:putative protein kinase RLK-Pelle-URK-2 family [Helianthus annuus]
MFIIYLIIFQGKLQNGQGIAVARIYINDACGRFINEASTLLKLEHENLAKFLGYCIKETRLFLVYDFALPAMFGMNFYYEM